MDAEGHAGLHRLRTGDVAAHAYLGIGKRLVGGAVLLALVAGGLVRFASYRGMDASVVGGQAQAHLAALAVSVFCSIGYVVCKGTALRQAGWVAGIPLGRFASVRLFCESAVIDILTWPGKVWSDAYKYRMLAPAAAKRRLTALLGFRGGMMLGAAGLAAVASVVVLRRMDGTGESTAAQNRGAGPVGRGVPGYAPRWVAPTAPGGQPADRGRGLRPGRGHRGRDGSRCVKPIDLSGGGCGLRAVVCAGFGGCGCFSIAGWHRRVGCGVLVRADAGF
jgi:hypothetical protein